MRAASKRVGPVHVHVLRAPLGASPGSRNCRIMREFRGKRSSSTSIFPILSPAAFNVNLDRIFTSSFPFSVCDLTPLRGKKERIFQSLSIYRFDKIRESFKRNESVFFFFKFLFFEILSLQLGLINSLLIVD